MREIKFRAWDVLGKEYHYKGFPLVDLDGSLIDDYGDELLDSTVFIIEQYTGLKDKNGKEIYEGDIMRYDAIDYEIYWEDEYAGWFNRRIDGRGETHGSDSFYLVTSLGSVVSNIHENPELLNPRNSTELGEIK